MSELRKFTVGLVQMAMEPDPAANLARGLARVEEAARAGAQLICLPELFRSQYFCQQEDARFFDLAEPVPGPTTEALARVARERKVVIVAPLFERRAAGVYHNSVAVLDADGRLAGLYRKMHIPDDPAYYEKFYFTPGDLGFQAFDTRAARVSALICWDQWYPEGARLAALRGAAIIFYPTAIGWHPDEKAEHGAAQRDAWRTVQRAHAISNGVYVAAVNRVGHEVCPAAMQSKREAARKPAPSTAGPCGKPAQMQSGGIEFWGGSFLADPFGVVVAEASTDKEEILYGEADLERIEDVRRNWPFLRDRRIDAYAGLDSRFLDPIPAAKEK
jgi:N-carbamoylputrescine amidase